MKKTLISATLFGAAFATAMAQGAETAKTFNILLPDSRYWQTDIPTLSYTDNGEKKTVSNMQKKYRNRLAVVL